MRLKSKYRAREGFVRRRITKPRARRLMRIVCPTLREGARWAAGETPGGGLEAA
jgi:hypothetical protein